MSVYYEQLLKLNQRSILKFPQTECSIEITFGIFDDDYGAAYAQRAGMLAENAKQ